MRANEGADFTSGIRLLARLAPASSTFVDIGANAGDWTQLFLDHSTKTPRGLLFDPSTSSNRRLVQRFGDLPSIRILRCAVSDVAGSVTFHEEPDIGTTSSLVPGFSGPNAKAVAVDTLGEAHLHHFLSDPLPGQVAMTAQRHLQLEGGPTATQSPDWAGSFWQPLIKLGCVSRGCSQATDGFSYGSRPSGRAAAGPAAPSLASSIENPPAAR